MKNFLHLLLLGPFFSTYGCYAMDHPDLQQDNKSSSYMDVEENIRPQSPSDRRLNDSSAPIDNENTQLTTISVHKEDKDYNYYKGEKADPVSFFSEEIFFHIFSYLDKPSLECVSFVSRAMYGLIPRHIKIEGGCNLETYQAFEKEDIKFNLPARFYLNIRLINYFSEANLEYIATRLATTKSIRSLSLAYYKMSVEQGLENLIKVLPANSSLITLKLISINLAPKHIQLLAEALKVNKTLQRLLITGETLDDWDAQALAEGIKGNRSLVEILLFCNNIRDKGARALMESLYNHPSIKSINLGGNKLYDAQPFANMLASNSTLTRLDVSNHRFEAHGLNLIATALERNFTLEHIDLSQSTLAEHHAQAIIHILTTNRSLRTLDLSFSYINDNVVSLIASTLSENSSLEELILSTNNITNTGAIALAKSLQRNFKLTRLDLSNNKVIYQEGVYAFAELMRTNPTLKQLKLSAYLRKEEKQQIINEFGSRISFY